MNANDLLSKKNAGKKSERKDMDGVKNALAMYLRDVRKYKMLTPKEEKKIVWRMRRKDAQARNTLITANLRLVINIAKRYHHQLTHVKLEDLINAGNEGLIKAADRFKVKFKCRFSTYATYWIKQAIDREIANCEQEIRSPIHIVDSLARYNRALFLLHQTLGRKPNVSEISAEMGEKEAWVEKMRRIFKKHVSLDEPIAGVADEDASTLIELIDGSDGMEAYHCVLHSTLRKKIKDVLEDGPLEERERNVLCLRFGIGREDGKEFTLEEIGVLFDITRERVRQIEAKAIKKLQKPKHRDRLKDLL